MPRSKSDKTISPLALSNPKDFHTNPQKHTAAILEKDNAIEEFKNLIGATNLQKLQKGTIRARFATSIGENAVHGADSDENAHIEGNFHFAGTEIF